MNPSYNLEFVDVFTTGTVGPKGERVFYLQARGEGESVSLKIEKQQVFTLAQYLARLLDDMPPLSGGQVVDVDFVEPDTAEWVIGSMSVEYSPDDDRLMLQAEELVEEDADVVPARARFRITREQMVAFIQRAAEVVAAGRPPCRYCGRPLDDPSWCSCSN